MPAFDAPLSADDLNDARAGGLRGQEVIYRTFECAAYTLARRMTGCEQAAWDVMQDAFLCAFRRLGQYRGEAPFGHWLRSIVASEALMHLRAGRRWLELFVSSEEIGAEGLVEDVADGDLERALALLPAVPRSVLWLYHVEGYTHAEIAALCGRTVSFSKSQLSRAHAKLRDVLRVPAADARPANALRRSHEALV
jgi:RNA polymerase sigma factor (sigma-70 family)